VLLSRWRYARFDDTTISDVPKTQIAAQPAYGTEAT